VIDLCGIIAVDLTALWYPHGGGGKKIERPVVGIASLFSHGRSGGAPPNSPIL